MRIQHNIMAMSAYRNYKNNIGAMKKDMERLSSGYRINRAGDDAASLAISEKMRAQITGLETAQKNAKDGVSLVQTAEGALQEMHDMLNRMVELATQSANGTYDDDTDRYQLQKEIEQLRAEMDRIANSTNFNNIKLLDGSLDGELVTGFEPYVTSANLFVGGDLPNVGSVRDRDTVLHSEATEYYNTEMSVDLSGITWDTNDPDKIFKIQVGDVTFTLDATGYTGTKKQLTGGDLVNAILGKTSGIDVTVTDVDGTRAVTGGTFKFTLDGQEVEASASGGKLHFALTKTPTSSSEALNAVKTVKVNGVESAAAKAEFSFDLENILGRGSTGILKGTELTIGNYTYRVTSDRPARLVTEAIANEIKQGDLAVEGFDITVEGTKVTLTAKNPGSVPDSKIPAIKVSRVLERVNPVKTTNPGVNNTSAVYKFSFNLDLGNKEHLYIRNQTYNTVELIKGLEKSFPTDDSNTDLWTVKVDITQVGSTGVYTCSFTITAKDGMVGSGYAGELGNTAGFEALRNNFKIRDGYNHEIADRFNFAESRIQDGKDGERSEHYFYLPDNWEAGTEIRIGSWRHTTTDGSFNDSLWINEKSYDISFDANTRKITLTAVLVGVDTNNLTITYRTREPETHKIGGYSGKDTEYIDKTPTVTGGNSWATGEERKASTRFQLTKDFVAAGAKVTIGTTVYEFISDSSQQGFSSGHGTTYVDVSSRDLVKIAKNLAAAARGNDVWSVDFDGKWITLIEADRHANLDGNKNLSDYRNGCTFDLSTVQGVNDSLDYEGVLIDRIESTGTGLILQIGDTSDDFNKLHIYIKDCRTAAMTYTDDEGNEYSIADISVANQKDAAAAVGIVRNAINYISDVRGKLGAYQNRLEHTQNNLSVMTENIQDAESTIRDTDIAELMMEYTKHSILIQSAQAMLAQANQIPQGVLQLLL